MMKTSQKCAKQSFLSLYTQQIENMAGNSNLREESGSLDLPYRCQDHAVDNQEDHIHTNARAVFHEYRFP